MDEGLRNMCNLRRRNLHTHRIVNEGAQNLRHLKHRLLWRWQTGRLVVHNRIACSIYRGGRSLSETMDAEEQLRMFSIHPSRGNVYSNCEIYQSNQYTITWWIVPVFVPSVVKILNESETYKRWHPSWSLIKTACGKACSSVAQLENSYKTCPDWKTS